MKLVVATGSSAYLPEYVKNHPDLFVIPIPLIMDGEIYSEGIGIEADEYCGLLKNSKDSPATSQPVVGEVLDLYEELKEKGYDTILSIHLSSGISDFVNTLFTMKDNISGVAVTPYGSKITSMPMGHMVEAALDLNDKGQSLNEMLVHIDRIRDNTYVYLIVDDLNSLVRGGRLTSGAALIGSLLKIKPILTFSEGKIVLFEKIRSNKGAFARVEEITGRRDNEIQPPVKLYVIYANNLEVAIAEKERLQKKYPNAEIEIDHFGPVISTHLGEKAIGIVTSAQQFLLFEKHTKNIGFLSNGVDREKS